MHEQMTIGHIGAILCGLFIVVSVLWVVVLEWSDARRRRRRNPPRCSPTCAACHNTRAVPKRGL